MSEANNGEVDGADMSPTVGKLFEALSKAQGEILGAKKDATNPHFKSAYADLASIWDACRRQLAAHNLCVIQTTKPIGGNGVCIVTTLGHSSGEWIRGELYLPSSKADAQGFGSAITYGRRYALSAMVGVAPEDDDGNAASAPRPQYGPIKAPAPTHFSNTIGATNATPSLEGQLFGSVSLIERAVDANQMLAEAKTMGELNEAKEFIGTLKAEGLPEVHLKKLRELYAKRKVELSGVSAAG